MENENKNDFFVGLAKAKTTPTPVKIESDNEPALLDIEDEADGQLTVDVYQDKDDVVVQSTVAGVNEDDLEVNITNESVTIRGKRERSDKIEEKDFFYQECYWGRFSRSVLLPVEVDPDKSTAALKNGVLTIRMPKLSRQKAKKLKVKTSV
ncbi:MAG: Hsp20/alpha crystallin family protein [Patescibacteria group bacterium]